MSEPYGIDNPKTPYIETEALLSALRWVDGVDGAIEALEIQVGKMNAVEQKSLMKACDKLKEMLGE